MASNSNKIPWQSSENQLDRLFFLLKGSFSVCFQVGFCLFGLHHCSSLVWRFLVLNIHRIQLNRGWLLEPVAFLFYFKHSIFELFESEYSAFFMKNSSERQCTKSKYYISIVFLILYFFLQYNKKIILCNSIWN